MPEPTPKHGLILAAGRGSRLAPLTDARPKALVELDGRPLIRWQIDALHAAGISDITIVGGYRSEQLEAYTSRLLTNRRWAETNMVASLRCAAKLLRERSTVVTYADIAFHPSHARTLVASPHPLAFSYDVQWRALWQSRFDDPFDDAETLRLDGSTLVEIGRKPRSWDEIDGQYIGLLKFTPATWSCIEAMLAAMPLEEVDALDMTSLLNRLIGTHYTPQALPVEGRWVEVDSADDLTLYENADRHWSHNWRWKN